MRPSSEGCVADQADPSEDHPRHLQIDDDLHERLLGATHHLPERSWQGRGSAAQVSDVALAHIARMERDGTQLAVPIRHQLLELRPLRDVAVPNEVDDPHALVDRSVRTRNRIGERVAAVDDAVGDRVMQRGGGVGRKLSFRYRSAPADVAGIAQLDLG